MNWADLLEALLVAGFVLPLLLAVFRLIPFTACLLIQTTAFTVMTGWSWARSVARARSWSWRRPLLRRWSRRSISR